MNLQETQREQLSALDMFVINLDRTPERMDRFLQVNPHLEYVTRFPAVDGKTVGRAELIQTFAEPIFYTDGSVGNTLSHLRLWDMAAARSSYTTVFEDDAIVHKDFTAVAPAMISELSSDWHIVLWGWNLGSIMSFDIYPGVPCLLCCSEIDLRKEWEAIQKDPIRQPTLHRLHYGFGTIAYSISPAGARKLAALAVPIQPFLSKIPWHNITIENLTFDCVLSTVYDRLNAYACFPPLVLTRNDRAESTIIENWPSGSFRRIRRIKQKLFGRNPPPQDENPFRLVPAKDYASSREFTRKYAHYLYKNGDKLGSAREYLRHLFIRV
jgi:glycosyl transferase, family 25